MKINLTKLLEIPVRVKSSCIKDTTGYLYVDINYLNDHTSPERPYSF